MLMWNLRRVSTNLLPLTWTSVLRKQEVRRELMIGQRWSTNSILGIPVDSHNTMNANEHTNRTMRCHTVSGLQMCALPAQLDVLLKHICRNNCFAITPFWMRGIWCRLSSYGDVLWEMLGSGQRSREDPRRIRQWDTNAWHNLMLKMPTATLASAYFWGSTRGESSLTLPPRASTAANLISQPKNTRCVKQHELHSEKLMFHCDIKPAAAEEAYAV